MRGESRDVLAVPVKPVCILFRYTPHTVNSGCRRRPAFPAPSESRGPTNWQASGENRAVRTRARVWIPVIMSMSPSLRAQRSNPSFHEPKHGLLRRFAPRNDDVADSKPYRACAASGERVASLLAITAYMRRDALGSAAGGQSDCVRRGSRAGSNSRITGCARPDFPPAIPLW